MAETTPMRADELTEGDIIRHLGDNLMVYSAPEYLTRGMVFDALPLAFASTGATQEICLQHEQPIELIDHQRAIPFPPTRSDDKMNPFKAELDPDERLATLQEQWKGGDTQTQWEIAISLAEHPDWGVDVMPAWSAGQNRRGTIVGIQGRSKARIQWYQGRPEEHGTVGTVAFSQLKLVQRGDRS